MIELRDYKGQKHYLDADAVAQITEAPASAQWHGIRSYVRTFNGSVLECEDSATHIANQVDLARLAKRAFN